MAENQDSLLFVTVSNRSGRRITNATVDVRHVDNVFVASDYPDMPSTPASEHLGIHYSPLEGYDANFTYVAMARGKVLQIDNLISAGFHNVNVQLDVGGDALIVYSSKRSLPMTPISMRNSPRFRSARETR